MSICLGLVDSVEEVSVLVETWHLEKCIIFKWSEISKRENCSFYKV